MGSASFTVHDATMWRDRGFTPCDASTWAAAGFSAAAAVDWIDAGFPPRAAQAWRVDGVDSPQLARQWADQGITVESAGMWTRIEGITSSAAMIAVNAGKAPTDFSRFQQGRPGLDRAAKPGGRSP